VSRADQPYLDHLAVGTEKWADGYPVLVDALGGHWKSGGRLGEFAPCLLAFRGDMHLEIISPGPAANGFMRRFLDRNGAGPHHVTFHVPSLDATKATLKALGLTTFDGRDTPNWRESFLHPKVSGVGTLVQLAETDREELYGSRPPTPAGFPADPPEPAEIAWIGLTAESLDDAQTLFGDVLEGEVTESGAGWRLFSWGTQRRLLIRQRSAFPGAAELWEVATGVAHLALGAGDPSPARISAVEPQEYDPRLGLRVWSVTP
jgi:hypothetical protein